MHLTLAEAASLLQKSERQLRYMIQLGTLKADKQGKRWLIPRDQLPLTSPVIEAEARRTDAVATTATAAAANPAAARVVEDVLQSPPAPGVRYSVRSLQAWRVLEPLHRELRARLGDEAPAVLALRRALRQLAHGCHRFFRDDKATAYRAARDDVSDAVFHLLIDGVADVDEVVDRLENDALAALAGLLRRYEPRHAR